jgi:D-tagatose-1,6-bisphosphate aldolase subunit GatZ/KbaZ
MGAPNAPAVERLRQVVLANHAGELVGVPSVCSAEPFVLVAALERARAAGGVALVESTCNQVNQEGGYTGVTPAGFAAHVRGLATAAGLTEDEVVLGGDHLGPYPWRLEPADTAMAKARELVRDCVLAGYTKIHLDPSMRLGGDPGDAPGGGAAGGASPATLDPTVVARRMAELCRSAEEAWATLPPGTPAPLYVIGTEVPAPGGERAGDEGPSVTRAGDVRRFLDLARAAFASLTPEAWARVVAVVVQPGVEFGGDTIVDYEPRRAADLSALVATLPALVYEAHSTDYQRPAALGALVRDHFAILKVGPALTFAFREALFALEQIEREALATGLGTAGGGEPSRLRETLDAAMREDPAHWRAYYSGGEDELAFARAFSFSDRCRYYWPRPDVRDALERLLGDLSRRPIPLALLSQYLPAQYAAVRAGKLEPSPEALIRHRIGAVLKTYWAACGAD